MTEQPELDQQIISMIARYAPEMEGKKLRITILELCQHIQKMGDDTRRSRPAPSPSQFNPLRNPDICDIQAQAREDVLKQLDAKVVIRQSEGMSNSMGQPLSKYEQHYQRALGDVRGMIESLRSTKPQEQEHPSK